MKKMENVIMNLHLLLGILYKTVVYLSILNVAASPDGLVFEEEHDHPIGVIEIKCPFSFRSKSTIEDAVGKDKHSFWYIETTTESVKLKLSHN